LLLEELEEDSDFVAEVSDPEEESELDALVTLAAPDRLSVR
jgi:hypothetical protein